MKLAGSSSAFDQLLRSGDLTQLEWIDFCAHELCADGVVFDVRHFPRTDSDYLAQVKKMAVDLGLTVAALRDDAFFSRDDPALQSLQVAVDLGAPLLAAPLPAQTSMGWSDVQARLSAAAAHAKRVNVTIAVMNGAGTFAETTHDLRRVSKETDSAWLRYGPRLHAFDAASEPHVLLPKVVLAWSALDATPALAAQTLALLGSYRGFLALDAESGAAKSAETANAFRLWREASLRTVVNRT